MDNVPSSAIMAVIAIIVACALGTFIFASMQSEKEAGNLVTNKVEGVSSDISETDLSKYDGLTVTGADVKSAIKLFKGQSLAIYVEDHGYYNYIISSSSDSNRILEIVDGTAESGETGSGDGMYTSVSSNKSDKSYIDPTEHYIGNIVRDSDNGEAIELRFTKKNKS